MDVTLSMLLAISFCVTAIRATWFFSSVIFLFEPRTWRRNVVDTIKVSNCETQPPSGVSSTPGQEGRSDVSGHYQ